MSITTIFMMLPLFFCAVAIGTSVFAKTSKLMIITSVINSFFVFACTGVLVYLVVMQTRIFCFGNQLFVDYLSAIHLVLLSLVFIISSLYGLWYFGNMGHFQFPTIKSFRLYGGLWNGLLFLLILVLYANNLGFLWVMIEATTLVSGLLILTRYSSASIEAMWKYLLICSVGIAFAFAGTLLVSIAQTTSTTTRQTSLLWTSLYENAGFLNAKIMLAAFIFILVGYGTKAGIAPMHTWLPDAYSQAPTPVTAVLSGIVSSCALYAILRYLPLCEASCGFTGLGRRLILALGLLSMVIGAIFIPSQKNLKRFFAYCSIEHIGIICVGIGSGGIGTIAALIHTMGHSIAKPVGFITTSLIAKVYKSIDFTSVKGLLKQTKSVGILFLGIVFILCGLAPGVMFLSEFLICKSLLENEHYISLFIFLATITIIFFGMMWRTIQVCFGDSTPTTQATTTPFYLVGLLFVILLFCALGSCIPAPLFSFIASAAKIIEGGTLITRLGIL